MTKKSAYIIVAAFVMMSIELIAFPATGLAAAQCDYRGSWFGYGSQLHILPQGDAVPYVAWMTTVQGATLTSGAMILEYPGYDPTLNGLYRDAVRVSTVRGLWKKSGINTFYHTLIVIAVDGDGTAVWIGKLYGTFTFDLNNCDQATIRDALAIFEPYQDPFKDTAQFQTPLPPHFAYRMKNDVLPMPQP